MTIKIELSRDEAEAVVDLLIPIIKARDPSDSAAFNAHTAAHAIAEACGMKPEYVDSEIGRSPQ